MSDHSSNGRDDSAYATISRHLGQAWRDFRSIYYANTPIWRLLKSAGLVFMGFFLWIGSNLIYSYVSWGILPYTMAYGFVLLVWGPLTHFVVVPAAIRARRDTTSEVVRSLARHASKINFSVFLAIVLVLGTAPVGPMMLDFDVAVGEDDTDVDPDVECTADGETVSCLISEHEGYDSVVVKSGGKRVASVDEAPYEFEVPLSDLEESINGKRITIQLRDSDGETVRQYIRTFPGS
jgi:hypothetical protein